MLGRCNLLKSPTNPTGTYWMFSQVAQDLTCQFAQNDTYRVVPSRFACLNLNINNRTAVELGEEFQNYFENACTFLRHGMGEGWNPTKCNTLLWRTLEKYGLITLRDVVEDNVVIRKECDNLKYIGDININTYENLKDGTGYNEIYVLIPQDAVPSSYYFMEEASSAEYPYTDLNICGWEGTSTKPLSFLARTERNAVSSFYKVMGWVPYDLESYTIGTGRPDHDFTTSSPSQENPFTFNAIVVYYDVLNKSKDENGEDVVVYANIPMGIYLTGTPSGDTLTNAVSKWTQNTAIANQGTSYGLRICNRFLCSPIETEVLGSVVSETEVLAEYTAVMEAFAKSSIEVQEILDSDNDMYNLVKNHLALFRNNQTNVPYPRLVGDTWYWFVNGKNTGRAIESGLVDKINDLQAQINNLAARIETHIEISYVTVDTMKDITDAWDDAPWTTAN